LSERIPYGHFCSVRLSIEILIMPAASFDSRVGAYVVATLFFLLCSVVSAANTPPLAPHFYVTVQKATEVLIQLTGYDVDGDLLTVRITSLPETGTLNQLSQVYSEYGYPPMQGSKIIKVGTVVSGSKNRLVYARPKNDQNVEGKWGTFTYTVTDTSGAVSSEGIVTLVGNDKVTVSSAFSRSTEDWFISGNAPDSSPLPIYEASSRGVMNHYIYHTDDFIETSVSRSTSVSSTLDDTKRWYFNAPSKFLGKQMNSYGGTLSFHLSSSSGDYSAGNLNTDMNLVELECKSCATNSGIRLVLKMDSTAFTFDGKTKLFSLPLTENGGWLKDPKSSIKTWTTPSKCEIIEVLSSLTSLKILGDHTRWYESVSLDNVKFSAGVKSIPIDCMTPIDYTKPGK